MNFRVKTAIKSRYGHAGPGLHGTNTGAKAGRTLGHMMATRTTRVFFVYRRIRIRFWIARPPAQVMGMSPGVITPDQPGGGVGR